MLQEPSYHLAFCYCHKILHQGQHCKENKKHKLQNFQSQKCSYSQSFGKENLIHKTMIT